MRLTTHCSSIIQRAGVLPMSIAGIAKEVSTITISAWFFGDELTPVNITGAAITVCGRSSFSFRCASLADVARIGIVLFTYHKYRKTVDSKVTLDAHGNVIQLNSDNPSGEGSVFGHDVELVAGSYDATPIHPSVSWLKRNCICVAGY